MGSSLLLARKMYLLGDGGGHGVWRHYSELLDEETIIEQSENMYQWAHNCAFEASECETLLVNSDSGFIEFIRTPFGCRTNEKNFESIVVILLKEKCSVAAMALFFFIRNRVDSWDTTEKKSKVKICSSCLRCLRKCRQRNIQYFISNVCRSSNQVTSRQTWMAFRCGRLTLSRSRIIVLSRKCQTVKYPPPR